MTLHLSWRRAGGRPRPVALTCAMLLWAASTAAQSPERPAPGPAARVSLQEILARATERGPSVRAARERHQGAVVAQEAVPRLPNPVIELRAENLGLHSTRSLPNDVFATISQPFELGGKRDARVASADATLGVAAAEMRLAEWTLAFEVASLYVDALRARELLGTLAEQQASLGELVATLSQRVDAGLSAEADLRKFQTEHQRLMRQVSRTELAARSAVLRLSTVAGLDLTLAQFVPLALPAAPLPGLSDSSQLQNRPDIEAARARVARAEAALALERARDVPDLTVTAGYKRTGGFDTAVAGITMPINIFDRNRVATSLATGELAAARAELERTRQLAAADTRAYLETAERLAAPATSARQDLLEPAAVVRTAARASYIEGRGDVLQLVDAERVLAEASREVIELQLDALLAYIHARLSLGESPLP